VAETERRRAKQLEYNELHGITPKSIRKAVTDVMEGAREGAERGGGRGGKGARGDEDTALLGPEQVMKKIKKLEAQMYKHARNLEFEEAARIRDAIERLRQQVFGEPGSMAG
jgi:excinuclease ABC subunit B